MFLLGNIESYERNALGLVVYHTDRCGNREIFSYNGKAGVYIYLDELRRWGDRTFVSEFKQSQILKNFKNAMSHQDVDI